MSEPAIRLVVDPDAQPRVAKNRAASVEIPAVKFAASRVLAMALVATLENESESDPEKNHFSLRELLQRFEVNLIKSALEHTGNRQRRAARLLSINVSSLNARIKRYKLDPKK